LGSGRLNDIAFLGCIYSFFLIGLCLAFWDAIGSKDLAAWLLMAALIGIDMIFTALADIYGKLERIASTLGEEEEEEEEEE